MYLQDLVQHFSVIRELPINVHQNRFKIQINKIDEIDFNIAKFAKFAAKITREYSNMLAKICEIVAISGVEEC